jgi:two-component SAPR family response regulator
MLGPPAPATHFEVRLFGVPRISRNGALVPTPPAQVMTVLSLLVLNGHALHRDALVERLWPDASVRDGRTKLRPLLSRLRSTLGANVATRGETVTLLDTSWCDLDDFLRAGPLALSGIHGRLESYRIGLYAQSLWQGPPLETHRYAEWAMGVRSKCFNLQHQLWGMIHSIQLGSDWPPGTEPRTTTLPDALGARPAVLDDPKINDARRWLPGGAF